VNGFLPGEYNEASGAFTVRQSDAHSWVEAFFPETNSWVTFDPTPPAGRAPHVSKGLAAQLAKYSEALELMWFQYVVGYDKQEQRSLITSIRNQLLDIRRESANGLEQARSVLPRVIKPATVFLGSALLLFFIIFIGRRIRRLGWLLGLMVWQPMPDRETSPVDFYERFIRLLEKRGLKREQYQTPLEFAAAIGISEAAFVTAAYNRVRFGEGQLSQAENRQLEEALTRIRDGIT